jgi:hypothetical protein
MKDPAMLTSVPRMSLLISRCSREKGLFGAPALRPRVAEAETQ